MAARCGRCRWGATPTHTDVRWWLRSFSLRRRLRTHVPAITARGRRRIGRVRHPCVIPQLSLSSCPVLFDSMCCPDSHPRFLHQLERTATKQRNARCHAQPTRDPRVQLSGTTTMLDRSAAPGQRSVSGGSATLTADGKATCNVAGPTTTRPLHDPVLHARTNNHETTSWWRGRDSHRDSLARHAERDS